MALLFGFLGAGSLLGGFAIFMSAKSAVHEIEAFVLFLIAAVCAVGATLTERLDVLVRRFPFREPPPQSVPWLGAVLIAGVVLGMVVLIFRSR